MTTEQQNKTIEFLNGLNLEIDFWYLDYTDVYDFDTLTYEIDNNNFFNVEIIYYFNAIEYLSENDNSLRESLEIASDLGYDIKNINSELLASLLASQNLRNEYHERQTEIEDFFNELLND